MTTLAHCLGFGGTLVNILIYQQKTHRQILLCKLLSDVLWLLHYLWLGAYAGAVIAGIGTVRESIFLCEGKRFANIRCWAPVFIGVSILTAALSWKTPMSLFPACASVLSVISFAQAKPRYTRFLSFPISGCMLTYDVWCGSYAGIVNETVTILSAVVGLIRHDRRTNIKKGM